MVCVKVVCERWCVTKMSVRNMVCDKDVCVCGRWCVTKMCAEDGCVKDGV